MAPNEELREAQVVAGMQGLGPLEPLHDIRALEAHGCARNARAVEIELDRPCVAGRRYAPAEQPKRVLLIAVAVPVLEFDTEANGARGDRGRTMKIEFGCRSHGYSRSTAHPLTV